MSPFRKVQWPGLRVRRGQRPSEAPVGIVYCDKGPHQLVQVFLVPGLDGQAEAQAHVRERAPARRMYQEVVLTLGTALTGPADGATCAVSCPCSRHPAPVSLRLLWALLSEQVRRDPEGQFYVNLRSVAHAVAQRHA